MPTWGETLDGMKVEAEKTGQVDFDGMRRSRLREMAELTGNNVIAYHADFLGKAGSPQTQVELADMTGMMEVFHGLSGPRLDLILHSPGGQAEAADRLVHYMRSKFDYIRVFVPLAAMSAATMWAMAADEIVLGKHSQLGPIDPQIFIAGSPYPMPAGALIAQFKEASDECAADPSRITAWLPTLQQYPPGLLQLCESTAALSKTLVGQWLAAYMLRGNDDPVADGERIAAWLADDSVHLSHSRAITRDDLNDQGVKVTDLEDDQALQEAVLSIHHAYNHTCGSTSVVKIIENHLGRAWVQNAPMMMAPQMMPLQMVPPPGLP